MRYQKVIKLDTYSCEVVINISDDIINEAKKIYKRLEQPFIFEGAAEGLVINLNIDKYYLLIDAHYLTHNTIAHEIYHVVVRVTEDRDIVDEESQAWLAGLITEKMYKFISLKNLEVGHEAK
jgi:hypothetical protein